jgi:DNA helicase HerA-like ATPase
MTLGIVDVGSRPHEFNFIANRPVKVGEYVVVKTEEGEVLALVEDSVIQSQLLGDAKSYLSAREASKLAAENPRDKKYVASARVLGLIDGLKKGETKIPALPAMPGEEVKEADNSTLSSIFTRDGWAKIGSLLRNEKVEVSVNLSKLASRHLAILAATGSGKSNLLALIAKRISEVKGTMLILDYHAEYTQLNIEGVIHIQPKVNPKLLDSEELADMLDIRRDASKQRTLLSEVFNRSVMNADNFWDALSAEINKSMNDENVDSDSQRLARRLNEIVQRARRRKGQVIDPSIGDPIDQIAPGHINVMSLAELTEAQADIVISYYLERILEDRKNAIRSRFEKVEEKVRFKTPIVIAIEEAHTFLPSQEGRTTRSKELAAKIAREGRKFGVSLIIVSQRPSKLDQDILSQMGSLAVSRITQPTDQSYISQSTEFLSEELSSFLPSLNIGETLLLGQWVTLPSVVKVEKVPEKLIGADIDAVSEWIHASKINNIAKENTSSFIRDD